VTEIIKLLEIEGGKDFAQSQANNLVDEALSTLEEAHPIGNAGDALTNLALRLVNRQT
jgi:geranylgeranyl pyrophosphate synthase